MAAGTNAEFLKSSTYYASTSATTTSAECTGDHSVFEAGKCHTFAVEDLCHLWTAATTKLVVSASTTQTAETGYANCKTWTWAAKSGDIAAHWVGTPKTWGDAIDTYMTPGGASTSNTLWAEGATNDLLATTTLTRGQQWFDHFPNVPQIGAGAVHNDLPRNAWIWSNDDQVSCMNAYNAEFYKFKQRVCVLTRRLFELVAGYGLGGSSVALFGRVGGGIYTKAADVGADLVGKTLKDLKEDDITNPGTIADNVGDNVGDIAGMGSDLFGSLAESTCAALVVSATSYELVKHPNALFFPVAVTASGTVASWFSVLLAHIRTVEVANVQSILKF